MRYPEFFGPRVPLNQWPNVGLCFSPSGTGDWFQDPYADPYPV